MGRRSTIVLGALALILVAVGAFAGRSDQDPQDGRRPHASPPGDLVDWAARVVRLDDGRWSARFCEGDGPFVCLTDAEGNSGTVELSSWPAHELDVIAELLASGATEAEALDAFVADFLRTFRADRPEGCGPDAEFVPEGPTAASVGARPGVRYGFRMVRDGVTIEHVLGHAVIAGRSLHLINTSALADDACLAREGEFAITAFDAHTAEVIGRLAAASALPSTTAGAPR